MEIFTSMVAVAKRMEFYMAKPYLAFMNVNVKDYFYMHNLIFAGKSIFAGFASMSIVPMWITLAIFFASIMNTYLQSPDNALLHMAAKVIAATVIYWNPKREKVSILVWIILQWDNNFQIFVDIYLVLTVVIYLIQHFGRKYGKAFTLICIVLCFDWFTDSYKRSSHLSIYETIVVAFLFLGFSFLVLRPLRIISNYSYVYACGTSLAWFSYKFYRIASDHGFIVHSSDYQSGNWKDEMLNVIEVYVYDVLKYFTSHELDVKYKSTCVKEFVKVPYEIISIEPDSNGSAL